MISKCTQYPDLRNVMFFAMPTLFRTGFCLTLACASFVMHGQFEVSSWRDHYPYGSAFEVAVGAGVVMGRTPNALFSVDTATYEVTRWVKGQGLSQSNPSAIKYDDARAQWVVGYEDGGIDIFDDWGVINVPDLRITQVIGDKAIRAITIEDGFAYLASAVGIVVLDLTKQEIADTWSLMPPSVQVEARCIMLHEGKWLVGTDLGILAADQNDPFLANPDRWEPWDVYPDLGAVVELKRFGQEWWVATEVEGTNRAIVWRGNDEGLWEVMQGWNVNGLPYGGMASGDWILDDDGSRTEGLIVASCCTAWGWDTLGVAVPQMMELPSFTGVRDMAIASEDNNGRVWLAGSVGGVVTWVPQPTATSVSNRTNSPSGPPKPAVRNMDCWNDNLWVASGGVNTAWTPLYSSDGIYQFSEGNWLSLDLPESANSVNGVKDIMDVSIDPLDPNHVVFSSYEEGLIEVQDGQVVRVLNAENSSIELSNIGGTPRSAVSGIDFDRDGNLWFTTPITGMGLHVLLADGSTVGMNLGTQGQALLFGDVKATSDGYVWIVLPRGGGVMVYDPAGTPGDPSDDNWRILSNKVGEGALPSKDVFCIEEDLDREIWVGTANGPCVFYQSASVFDEDVNASQILISQDGNLQYLLETELIQSIIIDAGNRKWVGTAGSGVYVLGADGLTTDHHFTTDNSPLPSNDIQDLAMDYTSGEVYIGTANGILSYRGEATLWDSSMDNVRIMPNPVRADHTGPIVIDGLAYESTVHITDAIGNRIAQLESNGGRATWDGLMDNGQPAPYGVYLAMATDREGKEGVVVKFAVVR